VDKRVRWAAMGEEFIDIPAGEKTYAINAQLTLPEDMNVLDVIPHMHWLGHDMKVTATLPSGTKQTLIDVDHYDFNWQTRYTYKEPVHLPKGTQLDLVAHYDNSSDNRRNPNNPPKRVVFGEQTTNEMCFAFFSYTLDDEHLKEGKKVAHEKAMPLSDKFFDKLFDRFDANRDGLLQPSELAALIRFFSAEPESTDGKPTKADASAKMAVAYFGHEHKGALTRAEFVKMAATQPD